jgi:voltage-gated potassium channel
VIRPSAEGDIAASGIIRMPDRTMGPTGAILRRLVVALLALGLTVLVVYLGRDGYKDNNGDGVSLLDAVYYATVSLSTTGYGDTVDTMLGDGASPSSIVVVDSDPERLRLAAGRGLVTVSGNATRSEVLRTAGVPAASSIVVAPSRDDTAVLVTLTARELAPSATIVAAVRETENVHLVRQSGADSVVVSSETAGRLLGMATTTPNVVNVIEDLITPDVGFSIAERPVEQSELGGSPRHLSDIVLGVVRGGELFRVDAPKVDALDAGDRLLYVKKVTPADED